MGIPSKTFICHDCILSAVVDLRYHYLKAVYIRIYIYMIFTYIIYQHHLRCSRQIYVFICHIRSVSPLSDLRLYQNSEVSKALPGFEVSEELFERRVGNAGNDERTTCDPGENPTGGGWKS